MVVSNHSLLLIISEMYFTYIGWKSPFHPLYSDCKPIVEERPANVNVIQSRPIQCWTVHLVSYTILSLTIRVCLHLFSCCYVPNLRNHAKFRAVRGCSRSSNLIGLMPILLIINSDCGLSKSCTFFEISTHKSSFPSPPLFAAPAQGNPPEFLNETYAARTGGMGLYGENCIIFTNRFWLIHPCDKRWTDKWGQSDGRAGDMQNSSADRALQIQ